MYSKVTSELPQVESDGFRTLFKQKNRMYAFMSVILFDLTFSHPLERARLTQEKEQQEEYANALVVLSSNGPPKVQSTPTGVCLNNNENTSVYILQVLEDRQYLLQSASNLPKRKR